MIRNIFLTIISAQIENTLHIDVDEIIRLPERVRERRGRGIDLAERAGLLVGCLHEFNFHLQRFFG